MAAASLSRSSFGAVLPFAAKPMYRALGVAWATSLLGFFSLGLCVVPFVFLKWGGRMRERSERKERRDIGLVGRGEREEGEDGGGGEKERKREGVGEGGGYGTYLFCFRRKAFRKSR